MRRMQITSTADVQLIIFRQWRCMKNLGFRPYLPKGSASTGRTWKSLKPFFGERKAAVVMGTEGTGLEQSAIDACDYTVMIPMHHGVDSLNVAAASAVAFWQLGRRTENCRNNADCNKND